MADHDRDAGSRGEEEAPRDPNSGETTTSPDDRETDVHPTQPGLKYGEIPPGPGQDYPTTAHTMPGSTAWGASEPAPPSDSFRDFIRRKPAQLAGAGLIGLILGALIGGTAVAVVSNMADEPDHHGVFFEYRDWAPNRGFLVPDRPAEPCILSRGEVVCEAPPFAEGVPDPEFTSTG